ncbi:MAG: amphi-Trp domain-containing protein [Deltaproteobacteria bacterium]|jgi:amphi-Trp domain-containing protein|nr:amphi-Trp domain-containing protein [Deltaproteobacteria bacterium]
MRKSRFQFNLVTDPLDVSRYLESLIQGFRDREILFSDQNHQLVLRPAEILELSLETSRRKGRVNFSMSFSWAESVAHKQQTLDFDTPPTSPAAQPEPSPEESESDPQDAPV